MGKHVTPLHVPTHSSYCGTSLAIRNRCTTGRERDEVWVMEVCERSF